MTVSLFLMKKFLDFYRGQDYNPSSFEAALWTAGGEITYTNYARAAISYSDFNPAGIVSNAAVIALANSISFPTPGAGAISGAVSQVRIFDNAGNLLASHANSKTLQEGKPISISAYSIRLDQSNGTGISDGELVAILDRVFRGQSFTLPATLYIDAYAANDVLANYGGYAQVALAVSNLSPPSDNGTNLASLPLGNQVDFPDATSDNTGNLTGFKVWRQSNRSGTPIITGNFPTPVPIEAGDSFYITSGSALVSILSQ